MKDDSISEKKILQAYRLLKEKECTRNDITLKLDVKQASFYRYVSIFKKAGFIFNKNPDKFKILNFYDTLEFGNCETSILGHLLCMTNAILPHKKHIVFERAVEKMLCLANEEAFRKTKEKFGFYKQIAYTDFYFEKICAINEFLDIKENMKILTNKNKQILTDPKQILWDKEKPELEYINLETNAVETICLDKIVKLMHLDEEVFMGGPKEIVFELYGNLSISYLLKGLERVVDYNKNKLVIANASQKKEELFKRLLRYDILCRVILPKSDIEEFENLIKKSFCNLI